MNTCECEKISRRFFIQDFRKNLLRKDFTNHRENFTELY